MDAFHADRAPNPVHTVHRVSAAALGCFLLLFGVLSFAAPVGFLATSGAVVLGLSTNGLLATVRSSSARSSWSQRAGAARPRPAHW